MVSQARISSRDFLTFPLAGVGRVGSSWWTRDSSRLIVAVRCPRRSSRRSTRSRSSFDAGSSDATGRLGSRSTARATARASIGSDLPGVREEARARLIRCGGTLTTRRPVASRSRSSRAVSGRQSSTPHTTSVPNRARAHRTASPCPALVEAMVFSPSLRPSALTATSLWVRLWASTPRTTAIAITSPGDEAPYNGTCRQGLQHSSAGRAPVEVHRSVTPGVGIVHDRQPEGAA